MTEHFTFFSSYYESVEHLEASIKADFFDVLFKYALRDELPSNTANPVALALFTMAKPYIDKSKARAKAGQAGGKQNGSKTEANTKQSESKLQKDASNKNKNIEEEKEVEDRSNNKRFASPTLDDVQECITEHSYVIDAETFFHYYESVGWKVGNKPMKSWQSALAQWNAKEKSRVPVNRPMIQKKIDIEAGYL